MTEPVEQDNKEIDATRSDAQQSLNGCVGVFVVARLGK